MVLVALVISLGSWGLAEAQAASISVEVSPVSGASRTIAVSAQPQPVFASNGWECIAVSPPSMPQTATLICRRGDGESGTTVDCRRQETRVSTMIVGTSTPRQRLATFVLHCN
ncbi:MAG: hypothetical protein R3B82_05660 [Sandaracinaceae bacterium]